MPEQFENGGKLDCKKLLQDFDAKEMYLHSKNRPLSFQMPREMFCLHSTVQTMPQKNVPVRVPFSKSTVFVGKNLPFSCKREAYPSHFSHFSKCAGIV